MQQMKNSGIEWVGDIPESWQIKPLYCFYSERKNTNIFGLENNLLSLSYGKVIKKDINTSEGLLPKNYNGYNIVEKDDIIIRPTDLQNDKHSLRTGLVTERGIITSAYIALKPTNNENSKFYHYLLHIYDVIKVFYNMGSGVRQGLNFDEFAKIKVIIPPIDEQRKIADFLDRKCEEIDGLSADIQAQIETLEQYKRSVITEAVTRGLNPSATTKDSGLWYGEIPENWSAIKGKYLFIQRNERGNTINIQLLSPTQKYGVIPQDKYEELTGMNAVKLNDKINLQLLKTIHKGDYCISLRSFQGGFEYSEYEGVVSPAYQVFYPTKNIDSRYYKYLFKEKGFIDIMNSFTMSLRDGKNIAYDDFGNTYIPYPPIDEQQQIADYLDKKCAEIDSIVNHKLYEYYVLLKILNSIKRNGYEYEEKKSVAFKYDLLPNSHYRNTEYNNTFFFIDGDSKITVYYQPVIYAQNYPVGFEDGLNGLALYRNTSISISDDSDDLVVSKKAYYTPDYIIKITEKNDSIYIILDAKYAAYKNTATRYLSNLVFKYLYSVSPFKEKDNIAGLCAVYGKDIEMDKNVTSVKDVAAILGKEEKRPFSHLMRLTEDGSTEDFHLQMIWDYIKKVTS